MAYSQQCDVLACAQLEEARTEASVMQRVVREHSRAQADELKVRPPLLLAWGGDRWKGGLCKPDGEGCWLDPYDGGLL